MFPIGELDKEQLNGLAQLSFDLAKGAFIVAIIPASNRSFIQAMIALVAGLAFTYTALVFLKVKKNLK